jgi:hypothetical protein
MLEHDPIDAAEAEERAASAAIGALGGREIAAMQAWIEGGCEGQQPMPDDAARRALGDRLARAIDAVRAARGLAGERV